jgi:hypothetical protein
MAIPYSTCSSGKTSKHSWLLSFLHSPQSDCQKIRLTLPSKHSQNLTPSHCLYC